jgi:hypothetical protein
VNLSLNCYHYTRNVYLFSTRNCATLRVGLKDVCWYGCILPNTRVVIYAYILFIFVPTISAAGRLLATRLSLCTTSLAVLICTFN